MKRLLILSALLFWLTTACKSGSDKESYLHETTESDMAALNNEMQPPPEDLSAQKTKSEDEQNTTATSTFSADKKIIKTAGIRMQVQDLEASRKKINALINKYEAYAATENTTNTGSNLENNLVIRVNYAKFDGLVEEIVKEAAYLN